MPAEEAITSILPEAEKKKTTRVDKALQKLKEDRQREEELAAQQRRERASQKSAMKNKISMISSVPVADQDDESKSEAQSEHQKEEISDQLLDRMKEREVRKQKLQE